jgi:hypothetical protein
MRLTQRIEVGREKVLLLVCLGELENRNEINREVDI